MQIKKIFIIIFLLVPTLCFAQGGEKLVSVPNLGTPQELGVWLASEFQYQWEMPDYWQPVEETLDLKSGDCEDFAILAQAVLNNLGIKSEIAIIRFRGLNQSHAICIFKVNGFYSFISNQKLIPTRAISIREAVGEKYPDWERIIFTNAHQKTLYTLANK